MDNSKQVFLQECQNELSELKARITALEERISALQEQAAQEEPARPEEDPDAVDFTGLEIGAAAPEVETEDVPVAEPEPEPAPVAEPAPVVAPEPVAASEPKPAPADTSNMAWRKDRPGIPVKNIRSGISLLDRAQFIGTLFKEDFALYDNTIAALNNMNGLDEAVSYIQEHFPQWNLGSEVAYRFIMAIRKKLG